MPLCNFKTTTSLGLHVIIHEIKPYNSAGDAVTFPIKGSVLVRKRIPGTSKVETPDGPRWPEFAIWRIDGRAFTEPSGHDIKITPEIQAAYDAAVEAGPEASVV